jgi:hypothetical protein
MVRAPFAGVASDDGREGPLEGCEASNLGAMAEKTIHGY